MRILALDIGEARIGVAVSDELGFTAQPLATVPAKNREAALAQIARLAAEQSAGEVLVGLPKSLSGELGPAGQKVMEWVKELEERLDVPVNTWDERFTTQAVERTLISADVSRKKRKKVVDKLAAAYLLQGYLDFRARERS